MKRIALALLRLACLGSLLVDLPPHLEAESAGPFSVVSTLDNPDISPGNAVCADSNGVCTLRAAVMEANAHAGPDVILLPADTFHMTIPGSSEDAAATGDLDLTGQVTLQGVSASASIIDAAGLNDRVIDVLAGAQASLSDLTIRGGIVPTSGVTLGGGLLNAGTLTLTRVTITHNNLHNTGSSRNGGGLANWPTGWLALNSSQVISNEAFVGAVFNEGVMAISLSQVLSNVTTHAGGISNGGVMTISSSQVLSNTGTSTGGGIQNYGQLAISHSLISGNRASSSAGLQQAAGAMTISSSTIRDNQAGGVSGGLAVEEGTVTLTASTLSHNSAGLNGGGVWLNGPGSLTAVNVTIALNFANGNGAGVYQRGGSFAGYNLTIAENQANADDSSGGSGGGIFREIGGALALSNTIVAANLHIFNQFAIDDDCVGNFGTFHYDLIGTDLGCHFTSDNTLVAVNPQLQSLANNGGSTPTMALGPGSAALDAGDPAGCDSPAGGLLLTDQRGLPRHADGNLDGLARCDMGAYEVVLQLFLPLLRR